MQRDSSVQRPLRGHAVYDNVHVVPALCRANNRSFFLYFHKP